MKAEHHEVFYTSDFASKILTAQETFNNHVLLFLSMEKAEIIAGLRSALERGYSLEFAKKSFVNAGYNNVDVEDSANAIIDNKSSIPSRVVSPPASTPVQPVQSSQILSSSTQVQSQQPSAFKPLPKVVMSSDYKRSTDLYGKPKGKGLGMVLLLSVIFVIVLGVLGVLIFNRSLAESILRSIGLI
jgi:hypothetical protein